MTDKSISNNFDSSTSQEICEKINWQTRSYQDYKRAYQDYTNILLTSLSHYSSPKNKRIRYKINGELKYKILFAITLFILVYFYTHNQKTELQSKSFYNNSHLNCVIYPKNTNYLLCKIKGE